MKSNIGRVIDEVGFYKSAKSTRRSLDECNRSLHGVDFETVLSKATKWYLEGSRSYSRTDLRRRYLIDAETAVRLSKCLRSTSTSSRASFKTPNNEVIVHHHKNDNHEHLHDHLIRIRDAKLIEDRIRGEVTGIAEGFLYVLGNPSWENWFKIGQTTDYEERLSTYQVYAPIDFKFEYLEYVSDRVLAEASLKQALSSMHRKGEWYNIDLKSLLVIAKNIKGKIPALA